MSSTSQQRTSFLHIGADCAQKIAAFLNTQDHFSLARANKNLYETCRHKLSWYHLDLAPPCWQSLSLLQTIPFTSVNFDGYHPERHNIMLNTCNFTQVQVLRIEENTLHRLVKEHDKTFASVRRLTINFNCTVNTVCTFRGNTFPGYKFNDIIRNYILPEDRYFSSMAGIRPMDHLEHLELIMHDGFTDKDCCMGNIYDTVRDFMMQGSLPALKSIIVRNISQHARSPIYGILAAYDLPTLNIEIWDDSNRCIFKQLPESQ
jgi:hypothetical protein